MSERNPALLRLGTRGSMLAQTQSGLVARLLEQRHPGLRVELTIIKTTGDQITEKPLHEFGGKGLFTKELEQALLSRTIDFAVHSFKDLPVTMPLVDQADLVIAAVPPREDPRDLLVCYNGKGKTVADLPAGARVGTGSLRRRVQLLEHRPDLVIEPIRGNIDTRLRKCKDGNYDAVILALAGVKRASLFDANHMFPIPTDVLLPAAGQGALALQCRRDEAPTHAFLSALNDPATADCVAAERELVRLLNGDCHSPIAALAERHASAWQLRAAVGGRGGNPPVIHADASILPMDSQMLAQTVFSMLAQRDE
jgi:hydroxymethylbilane synthase